MSGGGGGWGGRQGVRSRAVTMYGSQDPLGYDRGGSDEGGEGDMKKDSPRAHPTKPAFWLCSEATPQPLPPRQVLEAEAKSEVVLP